jgi:hypothetical protein
VIDGVHGLGNTVKAVSLPPNFPHGLHARHYGFSPGPACGLPADRELDFIINYDTCLRRGFGRRVRYRLGRDSETADE